VTSSPYSQEARDRRLAIAVKLVGQFPGGTITPGRDSATQIWLPESAGTITIRSTMSGTDDVNVLLSVWPADLIAAVLGILNGGRADRLVYLARLAEEQRR
jgi:hypothetical protein